MSRRKQEIERAVAHLTTRDPRLAVVITAVGPYALRLQRDRFSMLVRSIISQQISTAAARSILTRLEQLTAPGKPSPEALARLSDAQLRSAGISPQKIAYLRDLTDKALRGEVALARIGRKSNDDIIAELTAVKGIGVWTAQMFLIFSLGRLDVFPHADLGVRAAIRHMHGLRELPDRRTCEAVGQQWQPYASVASWYCWRSLDLRRQPQIGPQGESV
jgi:DNA-3-methyladenine glycosylase II